MSPLGPPTRLVTHPGTSVIRDHLLIGEYPTPDDVAWLADTLGVTAVVCLQDDADLASKGLVLRDLERAYAGRGVAFHRVPVPDGDDRNLAARLLEILALLDRLVDAGARVYLHCNAGFNRAPTVAIAHLHVREGLPLAAAREVVAGRRVCMPYMRVLEEAFAESR